MKGYEAVGLTFEDFQGHRYIRLGQLRRLLAACAVDSELRWTTVDRSATGGGRDA